MHRRFVRPVSLLAFLALGVSVSAAAQDKLEPPGRKKELLKGEALEKWKKKHQESGEDFVKNGVAIGAEIGSLKVMGVGGGVKDLAEYWRDRPALLVTASLTCGHARERQPEVEKLREKFKDSLNIVVLYTLEAHPVGSPSPYAFYSKEDEKADQPGERSAGAVKAGLARKQSTTLEQRKALAAEFQKLLNVKTLVVLDQMSNSAWKAVGGGPNMGLFVSRGGTVIVKHGWFDGASMERSIQYFLDEQKKKSSQ